MKTYYHITLTKNKESILNNGLEPKIGKLSEYTDECIARIYLFHSISDMETALSSWLGEAYEDIYGEDVELISLEINVPNNFPIDESGIFEDYCYVNIPPYYLRVFRDE